MIVWPQLLVGSLGTFSKDLPRRILWYQLAVLKPAGQSWWAHSSRAQNGEWGRSELDHRECWMYHFVLITTLFKNYFFGRSLQSFFLWRAWSRPPVLPLWLARGGSPRPELQQMVGVGILGGAGWASLRSILLGIVSSICALVAS